eukprot:764554-Hanusia_phi.AAC.1
MEAQENASEAFQEDPSSLARTAGRRRHAGGVEESRARGSGKQAAVYDEDEGEQMDSLAHSSSQPSAKPITYGESGVSSAESRFEANANLSANRDNRDTEECPKDDMPPRQHVHKRETRKRITKLDGMDTFGRRENATDGLLDPDTNLTKQRRMVSEKDAGNALGLDLDEGSLLRAEAKLAPQKAKSAASTSSEGPVMVERIMQGGEDTALAEDRRRLRMDETRDSREDSERSKVEEEIEPEDAELAQERADRLQLEKELMLLRAELNDFDENTHVNVSQQHVMNRGIEKSQWPRSSQHAPVVRQDISSSDDSDNEQDKVPSKPSKPLRKPKELSPNKLSPNRASKDRTFDSDSETEMRPISPGEEAEERRGMSRSGEEEEEEEEVRLPTPKNLRSVKRSDLVEEKKEVVSQARKQKFERMQRYHNEKVLSRQDNDAIQYNHKVAEWSRRDEEAGEEEEEESDDERSKPEDEESGALENSMEIKGAQVCEACGEPNRQEDKYCSCGELLPFGHAEEESEERETERKDLTPDSRPHELGRRSKQEGEKKSTSKEGQQPTGIEASQEMRKMKFR